jgi:hypothetical protein
MARNGVLGDHSREVAVISVDRQRSGAQPAVTMEHSLAGALPINTNDFLGASANSLRGNGRIPLTWSSRE